MVPRTSNPGVDVAFQRTAPPKVIPDGRDEKTLCGQIIYGLDQELRQSYKAENYREELQYKWDHLIPALNKIILPTTSVVYETWRFNQLYERPGETLPAVFFKD